jgi:thioredoxin reductase
VLYYSKRANAATGNHWKLDEQIKPVQFKLENSRTHDNSVKVVQNTTLSVWTNDNMTARSKALVFNSGTLGSWYRIPLRH